MNISRAACSIMLSDIDAAATRLLVSTDHTSPSDGGEYTGIMYPYVGFFVDTIRNIPHAYYSCAFKSAGRASMSGVSHRLAYMANELQLSDGRYNT